MIPTQKFESLGCGCDTSEDPNGLPSIDTALERIASLCGRPIAGTETLPLGQAHGRVLAEAIHAQGATPPFDASAMDGYALSSKSLTGQGPWHLNIVDEVTAGSLGEGKSLSPGEASRIFTGAPLPHGADTVVMQERIERQGDRFRLDFRPLVGENVRKRGEDMSPGDIILSPGKRLGPREIAALAAAGADEVIVRRKLRVALIVTGNEIREPGTTLAAAEIRDVNTPMLQSALTDARISLIACHRTGDDPDKLRRLLDEMADASDLIVTTGGISVGDKDHVKPAMLELGADLWFSGVAIKPGKPVTLGKLRQSIWLGLPGNPVSALTTWTLFGQALLAHLCTEETPNHRKRHVVTSASLRCHASRCELRPARLVGFDGAGRELVTFDSATHSARVAGLPQADGFIFIPSGQDALPAGAVVEFLPFCEN
ncbi:gephyrin-like molybdotransferase Glp [Celeribacter neptunius]|uniref:Molybdopterin molybdenumtransferase n=1 Tax=Celeribacter neptunius TaxID=588602 RepID=A0A1I3R3B6_9RHOB|nr:gephyrin-like molybdotransferase Glp [Celeribacter neptunius]SFJ41073.1 molybdopterin molybdochelatase [Celeribacter neptunius]